MKHLIYIITAIALMPFVGRASGIPVDTVETVRTRPVIEEVIPARDRKSVV